MDLYLNLNICFFNQPFPNVYTRRRCSICALVRVDDVNDSSSVEFCDVLIVAENSVCTVTFSGD